MRRRVPPAFLFPLLLLAACSAPAGAPPSDPRAGSPSTGPITSAGDPSAPVPFRWSTHTSHRPDGHRLRLQGGTLHAIPSELRLVDASERIVASAAAVPTSDPQDALCGRGAGLVRAELPLSAPELGAFRAAWPAGYRPEARIAGPGARPSPPSPLRRLDRVARCARCAHRLR